MPSSRRVAGWFVIAARHSLDPSWCPWRRGTHRIGTTWIRAWRERVEWRNCSTGSVLQPSHWRRTTSQPNCRWADCPWSRSPWIYWEWPTHHNPMSRGRTSLPPWSHHPIPLCSSAGRRRWDHPGIFLIPWWAWTLPPRWLLVGLFCVWRPTF